MNRIAVIYCSVHHKNTEKLISYVDTTDNFDLCKSEDIKLGDYDLIGFASAIYMGKLHGTPHCFYTCPLSCRNRRGVISYDFSDDMCVRKTP